MQTEYPLKYAMCIRVSLLLQQILGDLVVIYVPDFNVTKRV